MPEIILSDQMYFSNDAYVPVENLFIFNPGSSKTFVHGLSNAAIHFPELLIAGCPY